MKKIHFPIIAILSFIFSSCFQNDKEQDNYISSNTLQNEKDVTSGELTQSIQSTIVNKGIRITKVVGAALNKRLAAAIGEDGLSGAIETCSVVAIPVTDSVANAYNVEIKRITHKARNPSNRADNEQMEVINTYLANMEKGNELTPAVKEKEDHFIFYSPIKIPSAMCLKCHGEPKENMSEEVFIMLSLSYPEDSAFGFKVGDLRGIWEITFPKSNFIP